MFLLKETVTCMCPERLRPSEAIKSICSDSARRLPPFLSAGASPALPRSRLSPGAPSCRCCTGRLPARGGTWRWREGSGGPGPLPSRRRQVGVPAACLPPAGLGGRSRRQPGVAAALGALRRKRRRCREAPPHLSPAASRSQVRPRPPAPEGVGRCCGASAARCCLVNGCCGRRHCSWLSLWRLGRLLKYGYVTERKR